jgi:hypothetical protein
MVLVHRSITGKEATRMRDCNQGRFQQQFTFLRRQFLQDGDLPFSNILSEEIVSKALTAIEGCWLDRIYTPLVTLWVFLGQVLSEDHSCRWAVARLLAHRVSRGQAPCSAETGAYCQARKRLPEEFFSEMARQTGRALDSDVDSRWLWKGRRVYVFDGSSVSMPDSPRNQRAYPQPETQKPGLGFPLARIATVFSLSCGAVLDLGICRYAGKGQSEQGMLRGLWDLLFPGDIMLIYRARWNAELDLRTLKQTMHMEILRCKTPELVRKEIWTHILAYNLIRTIIAQAAIQHGLYPRSISFKGAIQTLEAFQPVIAILGRHSAAFRMQVYQELLHAIAVHRVADRPDRFEPRLRKRRPKHYGFLRKPRRETKLDMIMGLSEK